MLIIFISVDFLFVRWMLLWPKAGSKFGAVIGDEISTATDF